MCCPVSSGVPFSCLKELPVRIAPLLAATAFFAPAAALAQLPVPPGVAQKDLSIERVYESPSLNGVVPRSAKLSPDGRYLAVLRNRTTDLQRYDLWAFDRQTGQWRMLVDSEKLGSNQAMSEAEKMQRERKGTVSLKGIVTYDWSSDGKSILVPLDGVLYLAGVDGSVKVANGTGKGEMLNSVLSEKGKYLSFLRDNRLWVGPVGSTVKPITPKEGSLVHWGEAEFIAQEELDRLDRLLVVAQGRSHRGRALRRKAGRRRDSRGHRRRRHQDFEQRYPAAGTNNVDVSLYVIDPNGGHKVKVDLGPDRDIYLARVDWAPDGKKLYVQRETACSTELDVLRSIPRRAEARSSSPRRPPRSTGSTSPTITNSSMTEA